MTETLDDLLREHGRRWAAAEPAPPSLDDAMAAASAPRDRRPWLAVAAAVAVVAAAAAIPLARSGSGSSAPHTVTAAAPATPSAAATELSSTPPAGPDGVLKRLNDLAVALARENHDPDATGEAVRTTFARTLQAMPDWVITPGPDGSTPVWVIEIRGTFSSDPAAGVNGTAMGVTLNADTLQTYEFTMARQPYDLSSLGDVVSLPMSQ